MKKINVCLIIGIITVVLFVITRICAVAARGTTDFGGEAGIVFIPIIAWIVYQNILTTKEELRDYKISAEAEHESYIEISECNSTIQLSNIHVTE